MFRLTYLLKKSLKKVKARKFFMGKPSQNYGESPKYGVTQQASTSRLNPSR